jgi:hypothetical protein
MVAGDAGHGVGLHPGGSHPAPSPWAGAAGGWAAYLSSPATPPRHLGRAEQVGGWAGRQAGRPARLVGGWQWLSSSPWSSASSSFVRDVCFWDWDFAFYVRGSRALAVRAMDRRGWPDGFLQQGAGGDNGIAKL